jgi:hypothetical protein
MHLAQVRDDPVALLEKHSPVSAHNFQSCRALRVIVGADKPIEG